MTAAVKDKADSKEQATTEKETGGNEAAAIGDENPERLLKATRLQEEVEYARKVVQDRLEAPEAEVDGGLGEDELTACKNRLIAKGLVPDGTHVVFGHEDRHRHHVAAGKIPLLEDGEHTRVNELEAFAASDALKGKHVKQAEARSKAALQSETTKGLTSISEMDMKKLPPHVRARYEAVLKSGAGGGKFGEAAMKAEMAQMKKELAELKAQTSKTE